MPPEPLRTPFVVLLRGGGIGWDVDFAAIDEWKETMSRPNGATHREKFVIPDKAPIVYRAHPFADRITDGHGNIVLFILPASRDRFLREQRRQRRMRK